MELYRRQRGRTCGAATFRGREGGAIPALNGWPLKFVAKGYDFRLPGMPGKVPAPAVSDGDRPGHPVGELERATRWIPTTTCATTRAPQTRRTRRTGSRRGETGGHTHTGTATTATITGLAQGTAYRVQVRAGNRARAKARGRTPAAPPRASTNHRAAAATARQQRRLRGEDGGHRVRNARSCLPTPWSAPRPWRAATDARGQRPDGADVRGPGRRHADLLDLVHAAGETCASSTAFRASRRRAPRKEGSQGRVFFRGVTAHEATDIRVDVTATDPHGASASTHVCAQGEAPVEYRRPAIRRDGGQQEHGGGCAGSVGAAGGERRRHDLHRRSRRHHHGSLRLRGERAAGGARTFDAATRTVTRHADGARHLARSPTPPTTRTGPGRARRPRARRTRRTRRARASR